MMMRHSKAQPPRASGGDGSRGAARCWLAKSEPGAYSWDSLERDGRTEWDGVRNFEARNNLRAMREGDRVLFYHSVTGKEVVGVARVAREAYPDPSAVDGDWSCVDVVPVERFAHPVALATLKADPSLSELALLKRSRLSVVPVSRAHFDHISRLGREGSASLTKPVPAKRPAAKRPAAKQATAKRSAAKPAAAKRTGTKPAATKGGPSRGPKGGNAPQVKRGRGVER